MNIRVNDVCAGKAFVAKVKLRSKDGQVLALPGQTCEKVPDSSLDWLIRDGLIAVKEPRG